MLNYLYWFDYKKGCESFEVLLILDYFSYDTLLNFAQCVRWFPGRGSTIDISVLPVLVYTVLYFYILYSLSIYTSQLQLQLPYRPTALL